MRYALACTMAKQDKEKYTFHARLGTYEAVSKEEAIGKFISAINQDEHENGFDIVNSYVLCLEIQEKTSQKESSV